MAARRPAGRSGLLAHRRWLRYALPLGGLAVLLAGGGFAALETDNVSSYGEGIWWALSLVTTVGFVGEVPVTTGGRVLSGALMLLGFVLLSLTTATIASIFVREDEETEDLRERRFEADALRRFDELAERLERIESRLSSERPPAR